LVKEGRKKVVKLSFECCQAAKDVDTHTEFWIVRADMQEECFQNSRLPRSVRAS